MTIAELIDEFNILYNNITSNQAPGLSDNEIKTFLNQAQEAIVTELYNGNLKDSFESSEAYTRYLSSIVTQVKVTEEGDSEFKEDYSNDLYFDNVESKAVELEDDVFFIVYEQSKLDGNTAIVIPTTHNTLYNVVNNPFKGPNNRRVLRVSVDNIIELYYPKYSHLTEYIYRYVKKPTSVKDLSVDESLDLPEVLHRTILLRAVQLAKAVWQS